jgi:hypothetical protein
MEEPRPKHWKKWLPWIGSGFLIATLGLVWLGFRSGEPSYSGKNISSWLRELSQTRDIRDASEALKALRQMGGAATPYLIAAIRTEQSHFATQTVGAISMFSPVPIRITYYDHLKQLIVTETKDWAIPTIETLPGLFEIIAGHDERAAAWARDVLLHSDASFVPAIPYLLEKLRHGTNREKGEAVEVLGLIGPAAKEALPEIHRFIEMQHDPNARAWLSNRIGKIARVQK